MYGWINCLNSGAGEERSGVMMGQSREMLLHGRLLPMVLKTYMCGETVEISTGRDW